MTLEQAAQWAFNHLYHEDQANAAMHCAPVRFSPITFRLAETLEAAGIDSEKISHVVGDIGEYEEDAGR